MTRPKLKAIKGGKQVFETEDGVAIQTVEVKTEPVALEMFVIYDNPRDYPGHFVVRRFSLESGLPNPDLVPVIVTNDLNMARESIPAGKERMDRQPEDDPCIREVWL